MTKRESFSVVRKSTGSAGCFFGQALAGDGLLNRVAIVRRTDDYYAIWPDRWDEEAVWHEGSIAGGWLRLTNWTLS
jgi:hypothetical protein